MFNQYILETKTVYEFRVHSQTNINSMLHSMAIVLQL